VVVTVTIFGTLEAAGDVKCSGGAEVGFERVKNLAV